MNTTQYSPQKLSIYIPRLSVVGYFLRRSGIKVNAVASYLLREVISGLVS